MLTATHAEHCHVLGTVLSEEYSLCHLILKTDCNACYPCLHTSKPTDTGNLHSKALALSIAGYRASYITFTFSSPLPCDPKTTNSYSKPPH